MAQLTVADDEHALARLAAERVTEQIVQAAANRGRAFVAMAGGTTPRRLYSNLADPQQPWCARIPWPQVHLFWGDERHVPPEHPDSNYGMAKGALIGNVPIPADQVHRIHGELADAREAAEDYEHTLDDIVSGFSRTSHGRNDHYFDLMLLGLGEDAHIASIFPGSKLFDDVGRPITGRRVAAVWAPQLNVWRITLTPDTILDSDRILVVVSGANKAEAVRAAFEAPFDVNTYPAQLLRSVSDRVEWFLDRAAAVRL